MKTVRSWLIVRADGSLRINSKNPQGRLGLDEVAVPLQINIPDAWGRVAQAGITIEMPDPPEIVDGDVVVGEVSHPDKGQVSDG